LTTLKNQEKYSNELINKGENIKNKQKDMQPANNASKSTNKSIGPITKKKIVLGRGKETPTKNEIKNKGSYDNFKKDFQWNAGQTFSSQPGLYSQ
jgi:hypothetical protein